MSRNDGTTLAWAKAEGLDGKSGQREEEYFCYDGCGGLYRKYRMHFARVLAFMTQDVREEVLSSVVQGTRLYDNLGTVVSETGSADELE